MRELLRSLPALSGTAPAFDPDAVPDDPLALFADWFTTAVERGVPEPHAATLATADVAGQPSARVLLLKDVGPRGFAFATDARSAKVADLEVNPQAALNFWWQGVIRQVRVTGSARYLGEEASAVDFLARSPASRAAAAAAVPPGQGLASVTDLRDAMTRSRTRVEEDPAFVLPTWQAWLVVPDVVEFWQGCADRAHVRLVYRSTGQGWVHRLVAP
ncbi:pyridoxine/pyridoxamine 5'-phosphate oxidase [Cellulomonas wangsupingiae]|uniref:Pyridoxal 5'-phosphate synthase n=1 Tax=Cellulomonas wangsupingiae TaxID=2968085 RepID=A0ABY5KBD5_9CELL|nr:pyridoxal 5'-phosphate synthase [Cellulomonas wangsupingiae]MCC2334769.1 pyridoxal 5'-phosphate synthase [Cellulomonas wangsupingiae]MCM0638512.1 pyridoxal 5'-phosphate synthase [Cellulomonas wangsupingiae]UUI66276.1 pyridoxal 5'-phosphate synthase [Cellulomonas wangsupingiae]